MTTETITTDCATPREMTATATLDRAADRRHGAVTTKELSMLLKSRLPTAQRSANAAASRPDPEPSRPDAMWLFREGATVAEITWADERLCDPASLEPLWTVRLFGPTCELFARRRNAADRWQYRQVDWPQDANDASAGSAVLLFGQSTGKFVNHPITNRPHTEFVEKPNRFPQAELRYPGTRDEGKSLMLTTASIDPGDGNLLCCWTGLALTCSAPNEPTADQSLARNHGSEPSTTDRHDDFGAGVLHDDL